MEIEVLRKHGFSLRRIAAEVGCAVNTVRSLYSLIETCKANGVDTYRYLVALFKALPLAKTADDYEQLLPWHLTLGD